MEPQGQFVILLYDRTSSEESVNQARKQLFTHKGQAIDGLLQTQTAVIQHTIRAAYQARHCRGQMMVAASELSPPSDWGWKWRDTGGWKVHWTTLPEATEACRELLNCGCNKRYSKGWCKCAKAPFQCTPVLCHCSGSCSHSAGATTSQVVQLKNTGSAHDVTGSRAIRRCNLGGKYSV